MSTISEKAKQIFANDYNCSQAVFAALAEKLNFSVNDSLKIASAFGGGIARQQLTCGAVTGALMAIGLQNGRGVNEPVENKISTYNISNKFMQEFTEKYGSCNCYELLDELNMNNPSDMQTIKERQLFTAKCPVLVAGAVEIAEKFLF